MKTRRRNYNADEIRDRLGDLPDCVLIQILSILNTKQAVQTCILSTRWKNLWKLLPVISMKSFYFKTFKIFTKFVSQILSLRDDNTTLHTLEFFHDGHVEYYLLKRIIKYALSHNVKILDINMTCNFEPFPLCYFSCNTLTSLDLTSKHEIDLSCQIFPNSLNFPALTHLSIKNFGFRSSGDDGYADPFSTYKSLNTLIIRDCEILYQEILAISSVTLVNLAIKMLSQHFSNIELSTPNLCNFDFRGNPSQKLSGNNSKLSSIKQVNLHVPSHVENYPLVLLDWLAELAHMESLTLSSTTLKVLSLVPNLRKVDFPYLHNLKSLKIVTFRLTSIPNAVDIFLLQHAPSSAKRAIIDLRKHRVEDYLVHSFFKRSE